MAPPVVGIIANPVSARDIRRVIANASSLQITDRANIVLRVLASLKATGIEDVLMMPEQGGIRFHVERAFSRAIESERDHFPRLHHIDMPITGTVEDTHRAATAMREAGVAAIVVLGGDGTHRAVVTCCGRVPIAGISTGTNNAFPEHREPTITGLAVGLAATGRVPASSAFFRNKRLKVRIESPRHDPVEEIALVDAAIVSERYVGARALWRIETFRELYVTFADPEVIGMSAIAGLLHPVTRSEKGGLMVRFASEREAASRVRAPIAPGMIVPVGIAGWEPLPPGKLRVPETPAGSVALDGEREVTFDEGDDVSVVLEDNAFLTVDVSAVMQIAARQGLLGTPQAAALQR